MIQSFTIENFKSFERATLPLAPLTLLIGANASGKSNAIEAMQLLSWLTLGESPSDLLYAIREQKISLRGSFNDLSSHTGPITFSCKWTQAADSEPLSLSLLKPQKTGSAYLIREEFERECQLNPARRVYIWSRDKHLSSYDRIP